MESFTDVAWDTSGEMMAETVHKDILSGDYEKLRALFKDGMSNMMLSGDIMNLVELFNGWISGKSEKGPFEPFILMITNIPGKNNPLIISGEDVNY